MKYAFTNGKILNGTENMQAQEGLCILTDGRLCSHCCRQY